MNCSLRSDIAEFVKTSSLYKSKGVDYIGMENSIIQAKILADYVAPSSVAPVDEAPSVPVPN